MLDLDLFQMVKIYSGYVTGFIRLKLCKQIQQKMSKNEKSPINGFYCY